MSNDAWVSRWDGVMAGAMLFAATLLDAMPLWWGAGMVVVVLVWLASVLVRKHRGQA